MFRPSTYLPLLKAVCRQDESAQHAWANGVLHRIRPECGAISEAVWRALLPLSPTAQETFAVEPAYSALHRDRPGFLIGFGAIESACKTFCKQCESGGGMRWAEAGAQATATLRAVASLLAAGSLRSIGAAYSEGLLHDRNVEVHSTPTLTPVPVIPECPCDAPRRNRRRPTVGERQRRVAFCLRPPGRDGWSPRVARSRLLGSGIRG